MLRYSIALGSLLGALWAATADGAGPGPEDYVVRVWGTKQGLPQDAVRAISQTPDGYLWVGTFNGVARFDGNSFQVLQAGNTPGLPNNLISALFCDRHGRLWIGHDTGHVSVLEKGKLRKIQMPEDWTRIPIRGFGEDSEGDIWVLNPLWKLAIISPAGEVLAPEIGASDSPLHFDFSAQDGLLRVVTVRGRCYVAHHRALTPDPDAPPAPSDGRRVIHSVSGGYWALRENRLSRWVGGKEVEAAGEVNWGDAIWATTCEWDGKIAAGTFRDGLNLAGRGGNRIHYEATGELPLGRQRVNHSPKAIIGDLDRASGDLALTGQRTQRHRRLHLAMPDIQASAFHDAVAPQRPRDGLPLNLFIQDVSPFL